MTGRAAAQAGRTRREKGTGSVTSYRTRTGTRWRYEIDVPVDPARPDEGLRRHSRGGFASRDEANDELTLLRADLIRKVPQSVGRDTFGAYGQRWLDGHACGNGTRTYIQRVLGALDPYIGTMGITDIRATDLAAAYRGLERGTKQASSNKRPRQGLATSTVARHANWVNTIFLAALDEGLIVKNPANSKHAGRPKGESAKRVKPFSIWNVEQLTGFCDWALAEDEPWARAWVLFARTGLRSGELLALRWGDLDFNKQEMRVERALHYDETLPARRAVRDRPGQGRPTAHRHLRQDLRGAPAGLAEGAAGAAGRWRAATSPRCTACALAIPSSHRYPAGPRPSPGSTPPSCESSGTTARHTPIMTCPP